jgi:signal transduction histidine kinase
VPIRKPSGPTLVTCALLVLLPALAILQYRWVGQVSTSERERMQRNLRTAAAQFRENFDGEIIRAVLSLQVGPATALEGASDRYTDRYETWLNTAAHPQVVAAVLLVDVDAGHLRLRRWDPESHVFDVAEWPAALNEWRARFEEELATSPPVVHRPDACHSAVTSSSSSARYAISSCHSPPAPVPQTVTPVFGFTITQLEHGVHPRADVARARTAPLHPRRGRRLSRLGHERGTIPRRCCIDRIRVRPSNAITPTRPPDSSGAWTPIFFFNRPPRPADPDREPPRRRFEGGPDGFASRGDETFRWLLVVQHQSGSLEAAVTGARHRNLGISFGVLLLLTVSIALLMDTSRRAQRLARQQMEFVAGVSHELRTPVAVIRSAAENLAHGVIGGDRVKSYGQLLQTEAKRLGEMVERRAAIRGHRIGTRLRHACGAAAVGNYRGRDRQLAATARIIRVQVHREFAADLPAGDGRCGGAAVRGAEPDCQCRQVRRDAIAGSAFAPNTLSTADTQRCASPSAIMARAFLPRSCRTSSIRSYRGADAVERQIHGNGLGLSLVKRIVAAHGGRVSVTTRAGAGSAFTIALPAAPPDARARSVASELQTTHG